MFKRIKQFLFSLLGNRLAERFLQQEDITKHTPWHALYQRAYELKEQERRRRRDKRKRGDRTYFGEEVWGASERHRTAPYDEKKLQRLGLPLLCNEQQVADLLGISRERLRWFTHDRSADTVWHYTRTTIPKRSGGERVILAPKTQLKAAQRTILHSLLDRVPTNDSAHGFVVGRSIASNAAPHTGKAIVLKLDLKDFFPTITYPRVRGWFLRVGYSFAVASTLALLCTARERIPFEHQGTVYYVSVTPRALPQGAPTSPALANLVAWRLDQRLAGLAARHGFAYTRYADDLTFSGDDLTVALHLRRIAGHIVNDEQFVLHPDKTRIYRRSSRQVVTGLVVNDQVSVPRKVRRRVRAILHNARTTGLDAQNRDGHRDFVAYLRGHIGRINMTNPQEAVELRAALEEVSGT